MMSLFCIVTVKGIMLFVLGQVFLHKVLYVVLDVRVCLLLCICACVLFNIFMM